MKDLCLSPFPGNCGDTSLTPPIPSPTSSHPHTLPNIFPLPPHTKLSIDAKLTKTWQAGLSLMFSYVFLSACLFYQDLFLFFCRVSCVVQDFLQCINNWLNVFQIKCGDKKLPHNFNILVCMRWSLINVST